MEPTKGSMLVNGRLSALIEVSAGFHQDLTGRENIYLNGTILGMTRREIDAKIDQIIDFSGIAEFIDTPVKRYPSGMYARSGFGRGLDVNPDILASSTRFERRRFCLPTKVSESHEAGGVLRELSPFCIAQFKSVAAFCPRASSC